MGTAGTRQLHGCGPRSEESRVIDFAILVRAAVTVKNRV
jgi:hypothetical protein